MYSCKRGQKVGLHHMLALRGSCFPPNVREGCFCDPSFLAFLKSGRPLVLQQHFCGQLVSSPLGTLTPGRPAASCCPRSFSSSSPRGSSIVHAGVSFTLVRTVERACSGDCQPLDKIRVLLQLLSTHPDYIPQTPAVGWPAV